MEVLPYILVFLWALFLESLMILWISGGPVPGLISRVFAANVAGIALLLFVSLTGWFLGWWPDIRNWALRDSFLLYLFVKWPIFGFLFRRWGFQRVFTLHVLSNFVSVGVLSLLFVYSPWLLGLKPLTADVMNERVKMGLGEIQSAVESYRNTHGYYPKYIWGGDLWSWRKKGTGPPLDPLLREGYLQAYPFNSLNLWRTYFEPRRVGGLRGLWLGEKSADFIHVRDLWAPIVERDPRFGYLGGKMGNVLPDPTVEESKLPYDVRFAVQGRWLPGGFFYRSFDLDGDGRAEAYILGVCGDESQEATMDCYDARLDALTSVQGGQVVPRASDGIRDGVIYRRVQGFGKAQEVKPSLPAGSGEVSESWSASTVQDELKE